MVTDRQKWRQWTILQGDELINRQKSLVESSNSLHKDVAVNYYLLYGRLMNLQNRDTFTYPVYIEFLWRRMDNVSNMLMTFPRKHDIRIFHNTTYGSRHY